MSLPIPVHDGTYTTWKERVRVLRAPARRGRGDAAGGDGRHLDERDAAGERRRHARSRSRRAARRRSRSCARTSSAPNTFRCFGFRWRRGASGATTRRCAARALAVINQTMARQYWPNGDAIGQQFKFATLRDEPPYSPAARGRDGWLQIVGVVADARNDGLRNAIKPAVYVPYTLKMQMFTQILVRTTTCRRCRCCATCGRSSCASTASSRSCACAISSAGSRTCRSTRSSS